MIRSALCLSFAATTPALADVSVVFREGAPKDRFTIAAMSELCQKGPFNVTLDLSDTPAGLIFDTTSAGAGVEVFQPLEVVAGGDAIMSISPVSDGDQTVQVTLAALIIDAPVVFTVDLDDTLGGREITVSDSEIAGVRASVAFEGGMAQAEFGDEPAVLVELPDCAS